MNASASASATEAEKGKGKGKKGEEERTGGRLTVIWHGVDPLVERRVELSDDVLLPLLADEPEERLRLVDRVLPTTKSIPSSALSRQPSRTYTNSANNKRRGRRTMVRMANARIWCKRT